MQNKPKNNALAMEKLIKRFQRKLKSDLAVCDLGSCQYATAQYAYEFILAALKLDRALFERLFKITYSKELTESEFIEHLRNVGIEKYDPADYTGEYHAEYTDEDRADTPDKIHSIADYYEWTRNHSWDLWSAAERPFIDFKCDEPVTMPTWGPILNVMAQSENWDTAIAIAYTSYLYGTDMLTFANFDT